MLPVGGHARARLDGVDVLAWSGVRRTCGVLRALCRAGGWWESAENNKNKAGR